MTRASPRDQANSEQEQEVKQRTMGKALTGLSHPSATMSASLRDGVWCFGL